MKTPAVSFHFSLDVATIYALEMALEAHKIKMKIRKQPILFNEEFLEECREELSPADLFWHLRASMAGKGSTKTKVRHWAEHIIHPLLKKAAESYKHHWKEILPSMKKNVASLIKAWKKHEKEILEGISSASGFPWTHEEIQVFFMEPIVGGHGDAFIEEGIVTFEAVKTQPLRLLLGLTHEIAHLNTASIIEQKDIRRKVLAEVVNDLVAQQGLVAAKILKCLSKKRIDRIFSTDISLWMTESKQRFAYNPKELKQTTIKWWTKNLTSGKNLVKSIEELFEEALPKMPFKQP